MFLPFCWIPKGMLGPVQKVVVCFVTYEIVVVGTGIVVLERRLRKAGLDTMLLGDATALMAILMRVYSNMQVRKRIKGSGGRANEKACHVFLFVVGCIGSLDCSMCC